MGPGTSMQVCPRCGVALPPSARFCRNCGLTLTASSNAVSGSPSYATFEPGYGPVGADGYQEPSSNFGPAENGWSRQNDSVQDPFPRRRSTAYPVSPASVYTDYEPPEEKRKRSFWRSLWGILVIFFLLLLVIGVSAFGIYYYSSLCAVGERNGLPDDVSLPCGVTFQRQLDRSNSATGPGSKEWVYTVDNTKPDQIKTFYQSKLPEKGWTLSSTANQSTQAVDGVLGCKGPTAALIYGSQQPVQEGDYTFSPPPQGSLLIIILIPVNNGSLPSGTCPGT